jgi:hypothetical protein
MALICAGALMGSCSAAPARHQHVYGPTPTAEAAIGVARKELAKLPDVREPFTAERQGPTWLVRSGATKTASGTTCYMVVVDAATGKAAVGFYQTAIINEKL